MPLLIFGGGLAAFSFSARAGELPGDKLRRLAADAAAAVGAQGAAWRNLREYAATEPNPEWQGWALFVAGYQEFQQKAYGPAADDLAAAAKTRFSFSDDAVYYQASALSAGSRFLDAATLLTEFASRFPHSHLGDQALNLQADSLVKADQPGEVIALLSAEPSARRQPALELMLANAYLQKEKFNEAAAAFQSIYYKFPLSSQANDAGEALKSLRSRMADSFPAPLAAWRIARADALYHGGRYSDALADYRALLTDDPQNPAAGEWLLDQGRCLWQLERSSDASQLLETHFASPDLEAERLALRVHLDAQRQDAAELSGHLAQLEALTSTSPALAEALSAAGIFYYRQLDWQNAAIPYRRLWELFPQDSRLRDDGWRLAWCDYLLGDPNTADVMHRFLVQFPDSARAPAALYWLGRVEEDRGGIAEARALYALVVNRFAHTYYAPHAAAHLATLRTKSLNATDQTDSGTAPIAASLLPIISAPAVPAGVACARNQPSESAGPALILGALHLPGVEQDYLRAAMTGGTPSADLRVLLAETYSEQENAAGSLFAVMRAVPGYSQMQFSDLPEEAWDFLYPRRYSDQIAAQARAHGLERQLVMGLIRQESAYNPGALSNANARGLMQLLPRTAAETVHTSRVRTVGQRLYDPDYNIKVGCAYLAQLIAEFDGQVEFAVAAYNAGDFRVKDWQKKYTFRDREVFLESIPIPATRSYVELVLRDAEVYRQLLATTPVFATCSLAAAGKND
jgi:soluble lytic murein transglycosylase